MGDTTGIQWTDSTWNPVTGCSKVSPGCAHCYAEIVAKRFWPTQYPQVCEAVSMLPTVTAHMRPRAFTDVQCHPDRLDQPLRWKKSRKVFVNSMSDLFHEAVPDAFIERVFSVMGLAERHVFQVLTKRPERMLAWFRARRFDVKGAAILRTELGTCSYSLPWPLKNVWLGVSVENQRFAEERIPLLLQTPALVRFLSVEPQIGPVDLTKCLWTIPGARLNGLHWVIVGGESGAGARLFDVAWARSIVAQCQAAGVPVFVKQLGANAQDGDGAMHGRYSAGGIKCDFPKLLDGKGGDPAEWPDDIRVREFPR